MILLALIIIPNIGIFINFSDMFIYLQVVQGKSAIRYSICSLDFYTDILQGFLYRAYNTIEWAITSPPKPHSFVDLPLKSATVWYLYIGKLSYLIKRIGVILNIMKKNILNDTVEVLINLEYVIFRADSDFFVLIIKNITLIIEKPIWNIFKITANTLISLHHVFFRSEFAIYAWALTILGLAFGGVILSNCLLSTELLIIANILIDLLLTSICLFFLITIYVYINYINVDFKIRYPSLYIVLNLILMIVIAIGLDNISHSFLSLIVKIYIAISKLYKFIEKLIEAWVYVNGKGKAPWNNPESTNPRGPNNPGNQGGPNITGGPGGPGDPNIPRGPGGPNRGSYFPPYLRHQEGWGEDQQGYSSETQGQDNRIGYGQTQFTQQDNTIGYGQSYPEDNWGHNRGYAEPTPQSSGYGQGQQGSYNQETSNPWNPTRSSGYAEPTHSSGYWQSPQEDNWGENRGYAEPTPQSSGNRQGQQGSYNQETSNPWNPTQNKEMPQEYNPYARPTEGMLQDSYSQGYDGARQSQGMPQDSYAQGYEGPRETMPQENNWYEGPRETMPQYHNPYIYAGPSQVMPQDNTEQKDNLDHNLGSFPGQKLPELSYLHKAQARSREKQRKLKPNLPDQRLEQLKVNKKKWNTTFKEKQKERESNLTVIELQQLKDNRKAEKKNQRAQLKAKFTEQVLE